IYRDTVKSILAGKSWPEVGAKPVEPVGQCLLCGAEYGGRRSKKFCCAEHRWLWNVRRKRAQARQAQAGSKPAATGCRERLSREAYRAEATESRGRPQSAAVELPSAPASP